MKHVIKIDNTSIMFHNSYARGFYTSQLAVASGYFDFSLSSFVCQVRLPGLMVARHKGNRNILLTLFVEKAGNYLCKKSRLLQYVTMESWPI